MLFGYALGETLLVFIHSIKASACILPILLALMPASAHASAERCSPEVSAAVGKHIGMKEYGAWSKGVITEHCKAWPADRTKTIALFVHDGNFPLKRLILALVNSKTNAVLSSYSGQMPEENSVTRVGEGSARLDTAPYVLSKSVRAFGVVFDTSWAPCAVDGFTNQELKLFVFEGHRIRPVFENSLPIYYWRRETTDCSNPGRTFSTPVTVRVLKSASNGFFDLEFTARESEVGNGEIKGIEKRRFSFTAKYDGKNYDLFPWTKRFRCWYEASDCTSP